MRTNEFGRQQRPLVNRFELGGYRNTVTLAVEILRTELTTDRRDPVIGIIGKSVCPGFTEVAACRIGRRKGEIVGSDRQRVAADQAVGRIGSADKNAVTRLIVCDLDTIGAALHLRIGAAGKNAEPTDFRIPRVADQKRADRRPLLGEIAVIRLGAETDVETITVERLARVQIDRTGQTAFDHLGSGVLVDDDRAEQFGRNIGEIQRLPADACGICGATIEL